MTAHRYFLRHGVPLMGLILVLTTGTPAYAASEGEREALARLNSEIKALLPIVRDAQRTADNGGRRRFNYAWLRQDLARIRLGIDEYLTPGRNEPRSVPPIRGEYLQ